MFGGSGQSRPSITRKTENGYLLMIRFAMGPVSGHGHCPSEWKSVISDIWHAPPAFSADLGTIPHASHFPSHGTKSVGLNRAIFGRGPNHHVRERQGPITSRTLTSRVLLSPPRVSVTNKYLFWTPIFSSSRNPRMSITNSSRKHSGLYPAELTRYDGLRELV